MLSWNQALFNMPSISLYLFVVSPIKKFKVFFMRLSIWKTTKRKRFLYEKSSLSNRVWKNFYWFFFRFFFFDFLSRSKSHIYAAYIPKRHEFSKNSYAVFCLVYQTSYFHTARFCFSENSSIDKKMSTTCCHLTHPKLF